MKRILLLTITTLLCLTTLSAQCTQTFDANSNITIGTRSNKSYNLSGAPIEKITFSGSRESGAMTSDPKISLNTGDEYTISASKLGTYSESNGNCKRKIWGVCVEYEKIPNYNYKTITWNVANSYPYPKATSLTITNNARLYDIYVKNIVVTQAKYLAATHDGTVYSSSSANLNIGTASNPINLGQVIIGGSITDEVKIHYSRANNISFSVADDGGTTGDAAAFKVMQYNAEISSISTSQCGYGDIDIDVVFKPQKAGTYKAKVVISNNNGNTITLHYTAECIKKTPTITWDNFELLSTYEDIINAVTAKYQSTSLPVNVTYQNPADEQYVNIEGSGTQLINLSALQSSGDNTITLVASTTETDEYYAVGPVSKTFKTVEIKVQNIEQPDMSRLRFGISTVPTLPATTDIGTPITWTSDNSSVIKIVGGQAVIVGLGSTIIHGYAASVVHNGDTYAEANATIYVNVIDPNAGCLTQNTLIVPEIRRNAQQVKTLAEPIPVESITFNAKSGALFGSTKTKFEVYTDKGYNTTYDVTNSAAAYTLTIGNASDTYAPAISKVTFNNNYDQPISYYDNNITVTNAVVTQAHYLAAHRGNVFHYSKSVSNINVPTTYPTNRINLDEVEIGGNVSEKITIHYSRAKDLTFTISDDGGITGDKDAFSVMRDGVTIDRIETSECDWGDDEVTVMFNPTRAGLHKAKVELSDNNGKSITFHYQVNCVKKSPTITWRDFSKISVAEPLTNAATASPSVPLTLTLKDPADAQYVSIDGTTITALQGSGDHEIVLIATTTETASHRSVSMESPAFKTTELLVQEITWSDNFTHLHVSDADQDLHATSSINQPITYTSDNTSVVSIVNGQLHIVGMGKTYIHAHADAAIYNDEHYDAADAVLWVRVIDPNAGCDEYANRDRTTGALTDQEQERTNIYGYWRIDLNAPPASISFMARHGGSAHIQGPTLQYSLNENSNDLSDDWKDVYQFTRTTVLGTTICALETTMKQYSVESGINRNAVVLRLFSQTSVTQDHYYSTALVKQATYLDRNGDNSTIVKYNVSTKGSVYEYIELYYSNIPEPVYYELLNNTPGLSVSFNETQNNTIHCGTYGGWGGSSKEDKANGYYSTPLRAKIAFSFDDSQPFPDNGIYKDVIVFKSGATEHRVPVEIHLVKAEQEILWTCNDDEFSNIEIVDHPTLCAYSVDKSNKLPTDLPITYTVNNDVASLSGTTLIFNHEGTVTITASSPETNVYNAAELVHKTVTVTKVTPQIQTAPTSLNVYNGYDISRGVFIGGNVVYKDKVSGISGTYRQRDTDRIITFDDQGLAAGYDFYPDNTNWYNSPIEGVGTVPINVLRATMIFDGYAGTTDQKTTDNWLSADYDGVRERLPMDDGSDNIIINAPIDITDNLAAHDVNINAMTTIKSGYDAVNGQPILGELTAYGTLTGATANNLKLESTKYGSAALRYAQGDVAATVDMYSKAYYAGTGSLAEWQFLGTPVNNVDVQRNFAGSWLYGWNEDGWVAHQNGYILPNFTAVAVTQNKNQAGKTYTFAGKLTNSNKTFPLSNTPGAEWQGFNIIANSYTAPIDVSAFVTEIDEHFQNAEATFYIFNTGSYQHWEQQTGNISSSLDAIVKGQYTVSTPAQAKYGNYQKVIPPMQGFFIQSNATGLFSIDYNKHVLKRDAQEAGNMPMRAPRRYADSSNNLPDKQDVDNITITIQSDAGGDMTQLFVNEAFNENFENGFDARKMFGETGLPMLYTITPSEAMAINFINDINDQRLGVNIGQDAQQATITIARSNAQQNIYLHDLLLGIVTPINADTTTYTFNAEQGTDETRFIISRRSSIYGNDNEQTTDISDNTAKAKIVLAATQLIVNTDSKQTLRLFDAAGKLIINQDINGSATIDISHLPHGIYTATLGNMKRKIVR